MNEDNLNGCNLSVLECRALLRKLDDEPLREYLGRYGSAWRKLEAGAAKETPDETRAREVESDE